MTLASVLRSEHAHFSLLVGRRGERAAALARGAGSPQPGHPLSAEYRREHVASVGEHHAGGAGPGRTGIVSREGGAYRIAEPFLAEWIQAYIVR